MNQHIQAKMTPAFALKLSNDKNSLDENEQTRNKAKEEKNKEDFREHLNFCSKLQKNRGLIFAA